MPYYTKDAHLPAWLVVSGYALVVIITVFSMRPWAQEEPWTARDHSNLTVVNHAAVVVQFRWESVVFGELAPSLRDGPLMSAQPPFSGSRLLGGPGGGGAELTTAAQHVNSDLQPYFRLAAWQTHQQAKHEADIIRMQADADLKRKMVNSIDDMNALAVCGHTPSSGLVDAAPQLERTQNEWA